MKHIKIQIGLVIVWSIVMVTAISLTSVSMLKSIKWNLYDSKVDYGYGLIFKIYAYQNLWTAHDHYDNLDGENPNSKYLQAYELINISGEWRHKPRNLALTSTCLSALSLLLTLPLHLAYLMKKKKNAALIFVSRILSSILCLVAGSLLIYALVFYKSKYHVLLAPTFYIPNSGYPDEDNLSTGFHLASAASALLYLSVILDILGVIIHIKRPTATVNQL